MSLPVVLMFLVVISILGTVGIRRATVGEALSRNQLEYETARQAAEAALRDAERDLLLPTGAIRPNALCARDADRPLIEALFEPEFGPTCPRGQCLFAMAYYETSDFNASPTVNPHPWWPTNNGGLWNDDAGTKPSVAAGIGTNCNFVGGVPLGTFTGTPVIATVARQPEYLIEKMFRGDDVFFRVTARGFGINPNTEVVLQTTFRPNFD